MKKFVAKTNLLWWIIGLLFLIQVGNYCENFYPTNWARIRDIIIFEFGIPQSELFYYAYYMQWGVTILAVLLVLAIITVIIWKIILKGKKQDGL